MGETGSGGETLRFSNNSLMEQLLFTILEVLETLFKSCHLNKRALWRCYGLRFGFVGISLFLTMLVASAEQDEHIKSFLQNMVS